MMGAMEALTLKMGGAVAVLFTSLGGTITVDSGLGKYATTAECHEFAKAKAPEYINLGKSGIACVSLDGEKIIITMFTNRAPSKSVRKRK